MKKYRLYLDESGDHTYYLDSKEPSKVYLGITGVIIDQEYYRNVFHPQFEELKQTHFPHDPDEPIVLHRKEIINRIGPFWRLRDDVKNDSFKEDLLAFLSQKEYCVISVVIDKNSHVRRYGTTAYNPYHWCLTLMMERYCAHLKSNEAKGDVMGESRGGAEDRLLKAVFTNIYQNGTYYRDADFFQSSLTSHELKLKPKVKNIAGLQIADLLAYPSKQEILHEFNRLDGNTFVGFGKEICECLESKYYQREFRGRIIGYGKKFIA